MPPELRRKEIATRCQLSPGEVEHLLTAGLDFSTADRMTENVVGLFGLPLSIATNFQINGKDYLIPLCIEEPSVVAAASRAALLIREGGGFFATADPPIMIGQVQLLEVKDTQAAKESILAKQDELLALGNQMVPSLVRRGGGVRGLEVRILTDSKNSSSRGTKPHSSTRSLSKTSLSPAPSSPGELVVHLLVDCQDAMGANLTNQIAESLAPRLAELAAGRIGLRILSNLSIYRKVQATCTIPVNTLAYQSFSGEEMRDRITLASDFAKKDPFRAATHNKGIMNGVDALVIATGNDFRAVEAGAHAYASLSGTYQPLAVWSKSPEGHLQGKLEMPLSLGTKGGTLASRKDVALVLKILDVDSAQELAQVAGCVGLATNLSALRALCSWGIQKAHMPLHHRSVTK